MNKTFTPIRLGTLALLLGGSLAHATEVAPYFYGWGFGSGEYKANWLMTAKNNGGVGAATIAFGVSGGGCSLGGGMESILGYAGNDVQNFINNGGKLILSFGGAAGTYLEAACSENDMVNLLRKAIDSHGIRAIDFDIEGSQLEQSWLNGNRNNVIRRLQQIYPGLYLSFTLPVEQGGLPGSAVNLLRTAIQAGVNISLVNIMTMDYGMAAGTNMGSVAIGSANGTFQQLKSLYPGRSDAQLWAMIGITPMIGKNDDATAFTPQHAQAVADFARQKGIGLLSYWALQRDQAGSGDYNRFSQHNSSDYQYYRIFASAKSSTPTPTPTPADLANGRYRMVAVHSGKCIDVAGAGTADGVNIQQYSCNGTDAQAFDVVNMGSGWYRLKNVNSGKAMDVAANATNDGANIHQWADNGSGAQRFALRKVNGVEFQIVNQTSGKCVDVAGVSSADSANIQQWACGSGGNQRFRFEALTTPTPTPTPTPPPSACQLWAEGKTYNAGTVVSYQGKQYKALVSHTAYAGTGWNPVAAPTLWQATNSTSCN